MSKKEVLGELEVAIMNVDSILSLMRSIINIIKSGDTQKAIPLAEKSFGLLKDHKDILVKIKKKIKTL